jgi:hypothetical protein
MYPIRGIHDITADGKEEGRNALTFDEIQGLKTPFLFGAVDLFNTFKAFKTLPHGQGTLNERATVLTALRIMLNEEQEYDAWEIDKGRKQ